MNRTNKGVHAGRPFFCRFALLVVFISGLAGTAFAIEQTLTPVERDLPPFSLQGVDGTLYDPEALAGKTWLINFWAVWCAPCLDELPSLNKAWAQLKDNNVGMLAINIGEDAEQIEQFLAEHNLRIDFPIVVGDKIRTLGNWSGAGLPYTVIVSPEGKIVYEAVGPREWHEAQFVDAVLALNESQSASAADNPVASALAQFHALSALYKAAIVAFLVLLVIALMMLIRRLSRRKPASRW